jgi:hypothetical protein
MNIIIITSSSDVEKLKQKARKIKKEQGISHHEALDQVAKKFGFYHWHHVTEMAALTAPIEDAFRNGLIIAYDRSEADFDTDTFIEINEELALKFCRDELWRIYLEIEDEEDPEFHDLPEEDQREYFNDHLMSLVFFQYTGGKIPKNIEEALKLTNEFSLWNPMYVWIRGKIHDTYGLPATDQDGNIVGVRF